MQLSRPFTPTRRNCAVWSRVFSRCSRKSPAGWKLWKGGPSTSRSKLQALPRMGRRRAQEQGCTRWAPSWQESLSPTLTRKLPSARPPPPGCSPDPGSPRHPPGWSQRPLRSQAAPMPAAPWAISPLVRAAGHATAPRRRPRGKRVCLAPEARTLESCSHHCGGLCPAGCPPRCTLGRPDCVQPCSPHSLPCKSRTIKASRSVMWLVVARGVGYQAAGCTGGDSETTFPSRPRVRPGPGRGTSSLRVRGWAHCSLLPALGTT